MIRIIRIMVRIENEIGREKVGIRIGETGIVGGTGVTQEAGAVGRDCPDRDREDGNHRRKYACSSVNPPRRHEEDVQDPKKKEKEEEKNDGTDHPGPETAEANRLRASFGLKPLKL